MTAQVRNLALLGSTGSIGRSTLDVVAAAPERFKVAGLTAHRRIDELVEQARRWQPDWIVVTDPQAAESLDRSQLPSHTQVYSTPDDVAACVARPEVDVVVAAVVGAAGLTGAWAALEAGKRVALANKETLVVAGPLIMQLAARCGGQLLPVDSEHSAVFQALQAGRRDEVRRIVLTASGGPFRRHSLEQLEQVSVADALAHPTWNMGPKITVDSATMMNKSLEVIEARWLFDFPPEQIGVVVHPQSIVHSLVEYRDGSVLAQLSPPDMKLPIQYALTFPERWEGPAAKLDWTARFNLEFEEPDERRFPALRLGFEVAGAGGTSGAVLNAANEAAVAAFLAGQIRFTQIVPACRAVLEQHEFDSNPSLDRLLTLDAWARKEVVRWMGC
ncbi:MAG: 1-deoxy-D-xylulose-5-phosphate reductoisomerase [Pirellulales bacterium]